MRDSVPVDWKRSVVRWTVRAMVPAVLALVLVVMLPGAATAWPNPTQIGFAGTGNEPQSVCVQGSYAYVTDWGSDTLEVFNITNPTSPTLAGSAGTGTHPQSVCVQGNYAYVVNYSSSTLEVFNISNPAAPTSVGSVATGSYPQSVCVQGSYAYVVNFIGETLQVFDVTIPTAPFLAGTVNTGSAPQSVAVQGGYAYVVNWGSDTLQVFAVGNPALPSLAGTVGTADNPVSVSVQGGNAYVVSYLANSLQVFDVSSPTTPSLAGSTTTGTHPQSVCVQGNYACVANYTGNTFQVFNVSNPSAPIVAGTAGTGSNPYSVCMQGGYAYVVNATGYTLQVFSIASPGPPTSITQSATAGLPKSVCVQGCYAYVANQFGNNLQIFDLSNPASPISVATPGVSGGPVSVCVEGNYAYVTTGGATVVVFDVSNPNSPAYIGYANLASSAESVCVEGRFLFVACYSANTLQVFDVSNPGSPTLVGSTVTGNGCQAVCVQGNFAYVLNYTDGTMNIYNVSGGGSPAFTGSVLTASNPRGICAQGSYVYVVNENGPVMQVIDVSNPFSPVLMSSTGLSGSSAAVSAQGNFVYVSCYDSSIFHAFNVSNPAAPTSAGATYTPAGPYGMCVQGGYALTVDYNLSPTLQVISLWAAEAPTLTTSSVSGVTSTTASSGGDVTDDGGAAVSARGVCWSTSHDPTTSDSHTSDGTGTGAFTSSVNGLTPGTPYYLRAYATNSVGTSYGNEQSFATPFDPPSVTTVTPATSITSTGATIPGEITATGGQNATRRGFRYQKVFGETTWTEWSESGDFGTGPFDHQLTGLTPGTAYAFVAMATNPTGTSYGAVQTFNTLPGLGIETVAPSPVGQMTATLRGDITAIGDGNALERGFFFRKSSETDWSGWSESGSFGTGQYARSVTGLAPSTQYVCMAFARDDAGTQYATTLNFTTAAPGAPTVSSGPAAGILGNSAWLSGDITDTGGENPWARGFQYRVLGSTSWSIFAEGGNIGTGEFWMNVTDLEPATTYEYRALAYNTAGEGYAPNVLTFTTLGPATVVTGAASGVTFNQATLGGSISHLAGPDADQRGFRYRKTGGSDWTQWTEEGSFATGSFSHTASVLDPGTTYEFQAMAHDTAGWAYGASRTFETTGPSPQSSTWYLAEGSTAWGFSTYINIENPGDDPVTVWVTLMEPSGGASGKGAVYRKKIVLPGMSQTVIDAASMLSYPCDFSTKIECPQGEIAVDRTMVWRGPGAASEEGHCSIGVNSPSDTWYLPEGSSNWGFETWTLVENPGDEDARVTLVYMTEGQGSKSFNRTVPARSRASWSMANDIGRADSSIEVHSDRKVIAERSVYRNNRREGSCSIGATAASTRFFLAEGTTAWGFTTYVLVQNPGSKPTRVTLKCQTPQGPVSLPPFELKGRARKTVRLNDVPQVADRDVSTEVVSSSPVVAERSMYWTTSTGEACHDSIGMSGPHMRYYLPDGQTSDGRETWTLVQNPNAQVVNIRVVYLSLNGLDIVIFQDRLAPGTRKAYRMNDRLPNGRASVAVESIDAGRPIVVERSMYWNQRGAGTDTIGGYRY